MTGPIVLLVLVVVLVPVDREAGGSVEIGEQGIENEDDDEEEEWDTGAGKPVRRVSRGCYLYVDLRPASVILASRLPIAAAASTQRDRRMLTRLKVAGFKNLVDVDVRFGPFTCVAGVNGVGKSNLFDAICFLSALASKPLTEAALSVREEGTKASDVRRLFHQVGDEFAQTMQFEAEMVVPGQVVDDFGQTAHATTTFLKYTLELGLRRQAQASGIGPVEILREELAYLPLKTAGKRLLFPHVAGKWRKSVLVGARRGAPFISTETNDNGQRIVMLHQDGGGRGRGFPRLASSMPRTMLSASNAAESPTCLCAKREIESWRLLQLEPSALRRPDELSAPRHLDAHGNHLPATLYHLANSGGDSAPGAAAAYCRIANRLSDLSDDVRAVWVDKDEKRELLTLMVSGRDGTAYPARSLSDGTLRFLALAVMELDTGAQGLICLEEPENGIHPQRIPAMLSLLQDTATDPGEPVAETNPLRQVIVNTHSPSVVGEVPDGSLLVARSHEACPRGTAYRAASFACLSETWREEGVSGVPVISRDDLLAYLNPESLRARAPCQTTDVAQAPSSDRQHTRGKRVADRKDLQLLLPSFDTE